MKSKYNNCKRRIHQCIRLLIFYYKQNQCIML
nr:MAG TPA: hypothetical protein [Caudoviricetes sp.]